MRTFLKFKNCSNLFFIIPLFLTAYFHLYFYTAVILIVISNSFLYHFWDEQKFIYSDRVLAYLLIAVNLFYCWLGKFTYPYFYIALIFVGVALYFNFRKINDKTSYNLNHGLWHIFSSLITLFSILTFVR